MRFLLRNKDSFLIPCPPTYTQAIYNVVSMTNVMSKFLAMGVPLEDIIRRSTVNPAAEIHRPELGTLAVGKDADIAVLELSRRVISVTSIVALPDLTETRN